MKKILLMVFCLAVVFAFSCQAAVGTKPTLNIQTTPAAKTPSMIIGVEEGLPYLRFTLNSDQAIDVGAFYNSVVNGTTTDLRLWGRLNNKIARIGGITTSWGTTLLLRSDRNINAAAATTTTIQLTGLVSASYEIVDNIVIYGNVNLLSIAVLSGGANCTNFDLLNGSNNAYTGIRIAI